MSNILSSESLIISNAEEYPITIEFSNSGGEEIRHLITTLLPEDLLI